MSPVLPDPISTIRIEELLRELKEQYTIIPTICSKPHGCQTFFNAEATKGGKMG